MVEECGAGAELCAGAVDVDAADADVVVAETMLGSVS